MELDNAYKMWDKTKWPWWQFQTGMPAIGANTVNSIKTKIMQCPSDSRSNLACLDGDGNGSGMVAALTGYLGVDGKDQFLEDGGQDGMLYVNSSVKLTDVTDGLSNTIFVGERPPSNDLYYGWMWAGSGDSPYFGATDVVLGVTEVTSGTPNGPRDFYRPGSLNDPQNLHRYHFWSLHPGGGMWLFGDGHVQFIRYAAASKSSRSRTARPSPSCKHSLLALVAKWHPRISRSIGIVCHCPHLVPEMGLLSQSSFQNPTDAKPGAAVLKLRSRLSATGDPDGTHLPNVNGDIGLGAVVSAYGMRGQ